MVTDKSDGACQLHNVQFYNLLPRAIVCSAFEPVQKKLALARDDGTIEIWNMANAPFLEKNIPGGEGISIEGLAWAGSRLFSVSLAGTLIEWDLGKIPCVKQSILVTGNAAWCVDVSKDERLLAVGTEGGYINVYRLDNEEVAYERILDKQEGRIVCCCFDWTGDFLVTGSADAVRVWDVRNGHAVHKMTTGRSNRNQETTVWAVLVMQDFTIVSADSRGKLVIYDGQMGTVLEQHVVSSADLLCLAQDVERNVIYVGGVEPTIRVFERMTTRHHSGDKRFVRSYTRRGHTHDIKTMTAHGRYLFSGGLDGSLIITAARPVTVDVLFPLLPSPASQVAPDCRLVLLKYVNYLEVWTLAPSNKPSQGGTKVLQIRSKNDEHIVCAAISPNGRWIIYSTEHTVRLLRYDYNRQDPVNSRLLRVRNTPEHLAVCYRADFTHDSTGLFLYDRTGEGTINFFSCAADDNEEWDHKQSIDAGRWLSEMVHLSAVSSCNQYLVCGDTASSIVVFERSAESKWKRSISLPRYKLPPTALAIQPGRTRLAVAFSDHKLFVYDFDQFSFVFSTYVKLSAAAYSIAGIAFDPRHESAMVLQNGSKILSLQYGPDIEEEMLQQEERSWNKRQRPMLNGSMNGSGEGSLTRYKLRTVRDAPRLVAIEWLGENELVATQANALSMVEHLPAAFRKKAYGKR
ncbi:U3 small nucleolar RNA-associated protein 4 homolog [Anopheles maculipalpis]|uniref:U3 small nucleolar RNA-associated protein 4 homolog n=1 Tax=Anopheles maculipalpis TaxID=1496333 RepID=UPI002158A88D|nr:U3 small nucleolar RNA-associated protein 4 homolog [Anopheles maculipalpis]